MINDNDILEWIKENKDSGKVSTKMIRRQFCVGYSKAKRCCDIMVDEGILKKSSKNVGYIYTDTGIPEESTLYKDMSVKEIHKTDKKIQRLQDQNTLLRKKIREYNRDKIKFDNIVQAIKDNVEPINEKYKYRPITISERNDKKIAIVQFSDLHFGEYIDPMWMKGSNKHDWNIASKKLQKYAQEVKYYLDFHEIDTVLFALTGDLVNSSRREDEHRYNEDILTVTSLTASHLLKNCMMDIVGNYREAHVYSVFGNESRIGSSKHYSSTDWGLSWDFMIHHTLDMLLTNMENFHFHPVTMDHSCVIHDVLGANIALKHGHIKDKDGDREVIKRATDRIVDNRVVVDYTIGGHIHETMVKNRYRRSASLPGGNAYSYNILDLPSSSEQNLHLVIKETPKRIPVLRTIPINLDYYEEYKGYELERDVYLRKGDHIKDPHSKFKVS